MSVLQNKKAGTLPELAFASRAIGQRRTRDARFDARMRCITVMFTDLEGSTEMMERLGDRAAVALLHRHDRLVRRELRRCDGLELKHLGDGFMLIFRSALDGLTCAVAVQSAFAHYNASHADEPLLVRCGLASGEPVYWRNDVFGWPVVLAARLVQQASGGEILVSSSLKELAAGQNTIEFGRVRQLALKGFSCKQQAFDVRWRTCCSLRSAAPSTRTAGCGAGLLAQPHTLAEVAR